MAWFRSCPLSRHEHWLTGVAVSSLNGLRVSDAAYQFHRHFFSAHGGKVCTVLEISLISQAPSLAKRQTFCYIADSSITFLYMLKTKTFLHILSQNHEQAPQNSKIFTLFCKKHSVDLDKNEKSALTQLLLLCLGRPMACSNARVKHFANFPGFFETKCWQPWNTLRVSKQNTVKTEMEPIPSQKRLQKIQQRVKGCVTSTRGQQAEILSNTRLCLLKSHSKVTEVVSLQFEKEGTTPTKKNCFLFFFFFFLNSLA